MSGTLRIVSWRVHWAHVAALLIGVAGCGPQQPAVAPVRGTVTLDGHPLSTGRVSFEPVAAAGSAQGGRPAFGAIQPDGTFVLSTYGDGDGAIVGEHRVTLFGRSTDESVKQKAPFEILRLVGARFQVEAGKTNEIPIQLTASVVRQLAEEDD